MALTRITKGVIKPNEDYETRNINATGIITATELDVNGTADISGNTAIGGNLSIQGVLTYEDVTSIDSVGIITAKKDVHVGAGLSVVGLSTFSNGVVVKTGTATTALIVEGNTRVTGILTVGTGSLTITDRDINAVGVVTGSNFKTGTSNVHNVGIEVAQINVLGGPTKIGAGLTITNEGNFQSIGISTALQFKTGTTNVHNVGIEVAQLNVLGGATKIGSGATIYADGGFQSIGVATATNFKTGTSNLHNVGIELAGINVLGADTPIGLGATVFNTGDIVSKSGAEFQGIVTATSFVGDGLNLTNTGSALSEPGSGTHRLVTTSLTSGTMTSSGTDSTLNFNFSTHTLSATNFSGNGANISNVDAVTIDGIDSSSFLRSDANDSASGSYNFTNSYNAFGNSTGSVSNTGSWNARLNLAGSNHARLDVQSVSDGIITTMYAHNGHNAGRVGTYSNHKLILMANAQNRAELSTSGSLSTTVQGTLWGASNDGSGSGLDADLWDGNQFSSYLNQAVLTTSTPTFADVYCNSWFRSNDSGDGLYNTATGQHFYSDDDDYWNIAGGSSANGLRFRDEHAGTIRGYLYANNSNEIGLLDGSGNWNIRTTQSGLTKIGSNAYQLTNGNNNRNMKFTAGGSGDIGISGYDSGGNWRFQLYGTSGSYGFLDANWNSWDIKKDVNGEMDLRVSGTNRRVLHAANLSSYASSSSILYIDVYGTGSTNDRNTANSWAQSAVSIPNDCLYIIRYYYTSSYWVGNHTGTSHEDRRTVWYKNSSGSVYWAGVDRS